MADLFAGLVLTCLLGIAVIVPRRKDVEFSRPLVEAMNTATRATKGLQAALDTLLPTDAPHPEYSETDVTIPAAALFRANGYDDFLYDEQRLVLLTMVRTAIKGALDDVGADRRFLRVMIEGHTDQDSINPAARTQAIPTNWELSSRRATGVLRFFEAGGMPYTDYTIIAVGYGDTRPVDRTLSPEGKARNRRIVIRIEPDLNAIEPTVTAKQRHN